MILTKMILCHHNIIVITPLTKYNFKSPCSKHYCFVASDHDHQAATFFT